MKKILYYVHPSAIVENNVNIGTHSKVWHFCHIREGASLGSDCILGKDVFIDTCVSIGNRCKIQNSVSVYQGVTMHDDVFCGPSCVFTNVINPRAFVNRMKEVMPTIVNRGATIGANATILCGNTLGRYSFIGAGAVVTKDVKDYALVIGVPAKQIGWVCKCGTQLSKSSHKKVCTACENIYRIQNNQLIPVKEV